MKLNTKSVFLSLIILCSLLIAQQPTQEWVRRFSGNGFASGLSVKLDSSGNVYVLLKLYTDSTLNDYGLLKYDPAGNLLWNRYYNSPGNFSDLPQAFAVSKAGDIYITGSSGVNFTEQMLLVKYNTLGVLLWNKTFPNWGSGHIILDNDENVIIVGGASASMNTGAALTAKLNSDGDSIWVKYFIEPGYSNFTGDVTVDDSNNVYSCGYYRDADYLVLKYSNIGDFRWYATYNNELNTSDIALFLSVDPNRNIYTIGTNIVPGFLNNNTLLKLNENGLTEWTRIFTGIIPGNGRCVQPAGIIFSAVQAAVYYCTYCDNGSSYEVVTLSYNSFGDSNWIRRYGGGINYTSSNVPSAIKLDNYNNIYVSGRAYFPTTGMDYLTIRYNPNGVQQWFVSYNGTLSNSNDYANGLYADTSFFYITGISSRQNQPQFLWDAATIKYNQPIGIISNANQFPSKFKLEQNYPNPFNSSTIINYQVPKESFIQLRLFDALGHLVKTLVKSERPIGYYTIIYDASELPSGVYFYQLLVDYDVIETKKMILVK